MSLRVVSRPPARADALVVCEGHDLPTPLKRELERCWNAGPVAVTPTLGHLESPLLVGLRLPENDPLAKNRLFGAAAGALIRERVRTATVLVPETIPASDAPLVTLGLGRGLYRFDRYKSERPQPLPRVSVVAKDAAFAKEARRQLHVVGGIHLARDLVNTPAEEMGPAELERAARRVAKDAGLSIRVLNAGRCARMGMGALTAVGRASTRPPRMIVLEHRGASRSRERLALAGKGVCFDTGGLNLKAAHGMLLMKKDMGGAAVVLGAAHAVGKLKPAVNVRFYLAVAENSVSGNAIRPGDIVRALDGTTIEIGNTDAEGRLVLADAVSLARKEGATRIVDVGTLTGAALIAMGRVRVPLLGSDEALLADVEAAADDTAERVWRMPVDQEYKDGIRGELADLRNVGPPSEFGVMAGGLFVGHFAGDVPWAHLDISPASWAPAPHDLGPAGATGVMVSTLARLASLASASARSKRPRR
ncbi:MAG: leucyl aminopeptidase family protein [Acidobacteriota bacterium]|nr:leucyl aminopeptidase family protein [Acidobacteriota bacterium]